MQISILGTEIYVNGSALLGVYPQMSPPFVERPQYVNVVWRGANKKSRHCWRLFNFRSEGGNRTPDLRVMNPAL